MAIVVDELIEELETLCREVPRTVATICGGWCPGGKRGALSRLAGEEGAVSGVAQEDVLMAILGLSAHRAGDLTTNTRHRRTFSRAESGLYPIVEAAVAEYLGLTEEVAHDRRRG